MSKLRRKKVYSNRNVISEKKLIELIKKHKSVKVVFVLKNDKNKQPNRERILTASGNSMVRYSSPRYKVDQDGILLRDKRGNLIIDKYKWSRYQKSCYQYELKEKLSSFKQILNDCFLHVRDKKLVSVGKQLIKLSTKNKVEGIVRAMFNHDRYSLSISEVYVGMGFKKRLY